MSTPNPGAVVAEFNRDRALERVSEAIDLLAGDPERHKVELRALRVTRIHINAAITKATGEQA
jgi:hypothetical protein